MLQSRRNTPDGELSKRTKAFALRVIALADALPDTPAAKVMQRQILKCGTSVGANYRAAMRARSVADFVAKLGIVEEETDESMYWMELIVEAKLLPEKSLTALHGEADEILSMAVSSIRTARQRQSIRSAERGMRSAE